MRRTVARLLAILSFAFVSSAQSAAPEITFTINTVQGRRIFRVGEPIELEFRFRASLPRKYEVHEIYRRMYYTSPIRFVSDPVVGSSDPLGDYVYLMSATGSSAQRVWPLTSKVVVIRQTMNDWLSFQKPGCYRVYVDTRTVTRPGQDPFNPRDPILVRSKTIAIEIVAPEPGWAEARLEEASRALDKYVLYRSTFAAPRSRRQGGGAAAGGMPSGGRAYVSAEPAASALRYLGTPSAAVALVRFGESVGNGDIKAGLWASPHRLDVIRAMEDLLESPDFKVDSSWLAELIWLSAGHTLGPRRAGSPREPDLEWQAHLSQEWKPQAVLFTAKLKEALKLKRGKASETSAQTLSEYRRSQRD